MFGRKNVFSEKTNHCINKNNSAQQAQQNNADANAAGEQFIEKKILRNDEQQKDQYKYGQFFHKQKRKAANPAAVPLAINVSGYNTGLVFHRKCWLRPRRCIVLPQKVTDVFPDIE